MGGWGGWLGYDNYAFAGRSAQQLAAAEQKLKTLPEGRSADRERFEIDVRTIPAIVEQARSDGLRYAIGGAVLLAGAAALLLIRRPKSSAAN